jgi:UDP-glucose 4-epimerase
MRILITGGAGFIGTNLAIYLIEQGHNVEILDDLSTGLRANIPKGAKLIEDSITNFESVKIAVDKQDQIIHLAARGSVPRSIKNPVATIEVNVNGTLNVLEAARKSQIPIIFSSSSSVYGSNTELPKRENLSLRPLTPYAASKLAGEALMMAYNASFEIPITTLRFFNVFGPWQRPDHTYSAVIPKWIWLAMNNREIEIFGDGEQSRDFTPVSTVCEVIYRSIENRVIHADPINLAFGRNISLNGIIQILTHHFPDLKTRHSNARPGDVVASQNDPTLLKKVFGEFQIESFEESVKNTINWFKVEGIRVLGGPKID